MNKSINEKQNIIGMATVRENINTGDIVTVVVEVGDLYEKLIVRKALPGDYEESLKELKQE